MGNTASAKYYPRNKSDLVYLQRRNVKRLYNFTKNKIFDPTFKFRSQAHDRDEDIYAIHYVAAMGKPETVEFLINFGADIKQQTETGITAAFLAIKHRKLDNLDKLLEWGLDPDEREHINGYTLLHYACILGQYKTVNMLLRHSADPEIKDYDDKRAVDIVQENKNKRIVNLITCYNTPALRRFASLESQLQQLACRPSSVTGSWDPVYSRLPYYAGRNNGLGHRGMRPYGSQWSLASRPDSGISTILEDRPIGLSRPKYIYPEAEKIQSNYEELYMFMNKTETIIVKLFTKAHFDPCFKAKLQQMNGATLNDAILDFVMTTNKDVFSDFVCALRETNQKHLANLLDPIDDGVSENNSPPPWAPHHRSSTNQISNKESDYRPADSMYQRQGNQIINSRNMNMQPPMGQAQNPTYKQDKINSGEPLKHPHMHFGQSTPEYHSTYI